MTRSFSYDAYAMNYNFGTYEVEKNTHLDTSFTLYDRSTVERLVRDNPQLLPPPGKRTARRIAEGKDKLWNQQQIQSVMLQSILQGEPIPKIADRLATAVGDSNKAAAVRNARTMTTGAENAGRVDSYKRAEKMGIKMEQMWVATLDDRTRYEHRQLDGMRVVVGEPFEIDGYTIRFPGDPQAEPEMVYNCRCTLIAAVAGTQIDQNEAKDLPRNSKLGDMTYEEWKGEKEKQDGD
jgi:SPP1 gp7 family putative phage head morphogenesis protein